MTNDPNNSNRSQDPDSGSIGEPASAFEAAVFAAFGDVIPRGAAADPAIITELRRLIALLREAPLDRPSNALRMCAERLFAERSDLSSLVGAWLAAARQVVMQLVRPDQTQNGENGLVASLAGFRGAAAPILTFRALVESVGPNARDIGGSIDAWLDLQIDAVAAGSRLRGQIVCEHDQRPLILHLIDPSSNAVMASTLIEDDGSFLLTTDARTVTLIVELEAGDTALVIRDLILRS